MGIVEQHIRLENEHDLEGLLRTFGDSARYDDEAWDEHYKGRNGVRLFYAQLLKALPDLEIEVQHKHVADDVIVVEVLIRGTHLGGWRGFQRLGGESSSRSAESIRSTQMTVLLVKKSTMIEGPY